MQVWLKATLGKLSQKSDVAVAIRYALERWSALLRFCEDGRVEMDNNAAERALRAVAPWCWITRSGSCSDPQICRIEKRAALHRPLVCFYKTVSSGTALACSGSGAGTAVR
jgi:hypothetical protein